MTDLTTRFGVGKDHPPACTIRKSGLIVIELQLNQMNASYGSLYRYLTSGGAYPVEWRNGIWQVAVKRAEHPLPNTAIQILVQNVPAALSPHELAAALLAMAGYAPMTPLMGTAPADVVRFNSDPDAVVMLRMRLGRDKATNQPDGGKIVVWPVHRGAFFSSTLAGYFPVNDPTPTVVAGDFNVTLHHDDRVACLVPGVHIGASELLAVMGSAQLCDIWRDLNPAAMAFTHWSASTSSGKRLDRFLVSECFSPALTTAALPAATALSATSDILPSAPVSTDHLPVSLMVTCMTSGVPRGRGILSFPLRLLNSKEPSAAVSAFIVKTVPPLMVCPASELIGAFYAWKSAFIDMAVGVDKRHRRDRQAPARAADHCARSGREGMLAAAASGGDVGAAATIWLAQKDNAAEAWRALSALAWDVAATLDQNKGETSSYYFHHQAREMHTATTMLSLNRPGRAPTDSPDAASFVSDAPKATKYVVDFFSSESSLGLFRPQLGIDPAAQHTLLTTLPKRLDGPFAALAEGVDCANDALAGMLTAEELQVALSHAAKGKVPGGDGIPYEVYRHWHGSLSPLLLRVFNTGFGEAGRTSPTPFALLLRGVVCLLSKPGKPGDELDGYRPISLLNSDVKLVMSIIANRLQVPLDYLIDIGQGAFIHGRDISHNVRYHLARAARFRDLGLPGWLVHSDLTKAYDTVNRGWLDQAMIRMGFRPDGVVRWCRILLGGAKVRVRVNGFFTPDFPMDSGLFQGSALSCLEWVIVLQPVMSYLSSLQAGGTLTTFRLPGPNGVFFVILCFYVSLSPRVLFSFLPVVPSSFYCPTCLEFPDFHSLVSVFFVFLILKSRSPESKFL
ncbi:hypothetical protein FOA52_009259 [Chlamydomonas sp. UWO 241]|nr:hypothetical protein FOA52_009259 [Chlamydomonas sp. UWO 241]